MGPIIDETPEEIDESELLDGTIYEQLLTSPSTMLQLSPLTPGEELAVLHTNHGDITLRFFPQEAPLAVENFITHAKNGYYDNLIFHRVMPNFMIQGGCPVGLGVSGESIFGEPFGLERSFNLLHFRGALAMAHSGPNSMGSQFYVVQNTELEESFKERFQYLSTVQDEIAGDFSGERHIYVRDVHPAYGLQHFIENGGTPHLDWHWNVDRQGRRYGHTVFGHVVSGMEVVDEIANVETVVTNDPNRQNRPAEDVIIESISFFIYE